jgi:hypothetical protein
LDIEPDENEADNELNAEEESEDIRQSMGEIEGYADGFTYDELTTVIHDADRKSDMLTKETIETLRNFAQTDMFEQLVSSDAGSALRIASILDRNERSLAHDDNTSDNDEYDYQDFDIKQFMV